MTPQALGRVVGIESKPSPRQSIIELMSGFTTETTPGAAAKITDYRAHLRPGATVFITFLPGSSFADTIAVAARLRHEGFNPVPHFAARSVPSRAFLDENLARLTGEAGVDQALLIGGALNQPLGEFSNTMQLLDTGLFDRHGIGRIGIAGHPEGSPDIPDAQVRAALAWKNAFAERTGASLYIVTQFCFEAAPVIAWDRRIQSEGNRLPIYIGIPGLASLKALIGHAKACGIGPSMRFLTRPGPQRHEAARGHRPRPPRRRARGLPRNRSAMRHPRRSCLPARRSEEVGAVGAGGGRGPLRDARRWSGVRGGRGAGLKAGTDVLIDGDNDTRRHPMADGASSTATGHEPRHKPKAHFENRATAAMEKHLPRPEWSVRQKLALTARMLAAEEHASALAGQITARGDAPGTMWTARFGLGFEEVRARDFLLVDEDLAVVRGDGMANPSNRFHLWIYRARPDGHCIVHTHPPYCSALSMLGVPLRAAHMDTAMFHEDCAWLETWPGPADR